MELESVPLDMAGQLEDLMQTFALRTSEKGLELLCRVRPEVPANLLGDPMRIRQIFSNLINNAIKFTEKGQILAEVALAEQTAEHVVLRCEVSDSGIGIPQERLDRLFKSFSQIDASTTRKYGGTGLGLPSASGSWRLWADASASPARTARAPPSGSHMRLPKTAIAAPAGGGAPPPAIFAGKRVLAVDDNLTNRTIIASNWAPPASTSKPPAAGAEGLEQLRIAASRGKPTASSSSTCTCPRWMAWPWPPPSAANQPTATSA